MRALPIILAIAIVIDLGVTARAVASPLITFRFVGPATQVGDSAVFLCPAMPLDPCNRPSAQSSTSKCIVRYMASNVEIATLSDIIQYGGSHGYEC